MAIGNLSLVASNNGDNRRTRQRTVVKRYLPYGICYKGNRRYRRVWDMVRGQRTIITEEQWQQSRKGE